MNSAESAAGNAASSIELAAQLKFSSIVVAAQLEGTSLKVAAQQVVAKEEQDGDDYFVTIKKTCN